MTIDYIVTEGNTYDEALKDGLNQLKLSEEQVEIEILKEKKSFLFKKGAFKLKLTPITAIDTDIQNDSKSRPVKNEEFALDYSEDGIYLYIPKTSEVNITTVLDTLAKKQVENYDYEKIFICLGSKRGIREWIAPYQEEILVDSTLELEVSGDALEARVLLTEPLGGKKLSPTEIIDILNTKGVKFGINNKKIEELSNKDIFNTYIVIAKGTSPIDGMDGYIVYNFKEENDSANSVIDAEGRIDYKNLNKINNVNIDTLLLEIIPPTQGVSGIDVYGKEILPKKGKDVSIKKGKNVHESEDGFKIFASKDGEVHFVDGSIYVDEVKTINGDVDNVTGNIQFNGKINIKGNVKSGFKVEAEGDIEIFGVVEGAKLISKGNIIIHRGVQGNTQAFIHCLKDLTVKYLENANVICDGDVVSDAILHSNVTTKGKITVLGKKGLIVGGEIKAGNEVRANIIGSNMGTITNVEVGINPDEKNRFELLKTEMITIEKNIDNSQKAIEVLNRMSKKQELNSEKRELLIKSLKTYNVLKSKQDSVSKELLELSERFENSGNGKVHAVKTVYPGVKIIIGNNSRQIYDELSNCTLLLKNAEVSIGPYEK